jgi:hypothetical protein
MSELQLHFFNLIGLAITLVVALVTRATLRRLLGALAGAGVGAVLAICLIAVGEKLKLWHMPITWEPYYLLLLWIDFVVCAYVLLIIWRIVRRFGKRGLAVALFASAVIGPFRDYWYMQRFPEWGYYRPGLAPFIAIAASYVILLASGYSVMRLVAGPDRSDRLARGLWFRQSNKGV